MAREAKERDSNSSPALVGYEYIGKKKNSKRLLKKKKQKQRNIHYFIAY